MDQFAKETLPISLEQEMRTSYLDYAMSVIVGRALPDVRDGLKPVHRRVLFGMHEKAGGQTVNLTLDQRTVWRKALEPVYPQIVKETGGDAAAFFAKMESGLQACNK